YDFTSPRTVYNTSSQCIPEGGGQSGFSVQVTRTVKKGGEVVEQRTYTHAYSPWNRVVCGPPPSDDEDDDSDDDCPPPVANGGGAGQRRCRGAGGGGPCLPSTMSSAGPATGPRRVLTSTPSASTRVSSPSASE